jgi:hypothetical protein
LEDGIPPAGLALVEDPETLERMRIDFSDPRVRGAFAEVVRARRAERERLFSRLSMDFVAVRAGDEYVRPLVSFFRARARRRAA